MLKMLGASVELFQKHGKFVGAAVIVTILVAWNVPIIRDGVLTVIGIGTHDQQIKNAEGVETVQKQLDGVHNILKDVRHFQLQSLITNEALPLELRMTAYDEYTTLGYNSWIHLYYEKELEPLGIDVMNYRFSRINGRGNED